ncbi:Glycosyltransferase [Cupriavidus oxalaticus]|uniref:glycosyltransferase family 4 protein n=1 Tax=Cupriavidus oxalaticus TaxID=96344 RepID=UPI003F73CC99
MKIGISCNRLGRGGGFERYALDLVRGLLATGDRPAVFARRFDTDVPEFGAVDRHTVHVRWLPGRFRDAAFSWGMRNAHRHCDVLIGCNRIVGADIAVCGGTHRGFLRTAGRNPTARDRAQISLETRHYEAARYVVAHSKLMAGELQSLYGLPESRIALLYPPVDPERFSPVDDATRAALRQQFGFGDELVFLFPSSDHERKGLRPLAEALAGSGINGVIAVAGRAVHGSLPAVRELGYCKNMADLYRAADFTVLASSYEPFGLVAIESVLCGTPALLADNIACLEVLDDQASRRFSRTEPASIRATLAAAAEWAASGAARLAQPCRHIAYDPGLAAHLDGLRRLF